MSFIQPDRAFVVAAHPDRVVDEAAYDCARVKAAVETVGLLGETVSGVLREAEGTVSPGQCSLEVCSQGIHAAEFGMLSCLPAGTDHDGLMHPHRMGQRRETREGIRQRMGRWRQGPVRPSVDPFVGEGHPVKSNVAGTAIVDCFHRRHKRHLVLGTPSRLAGPDTTKVGVIDLDTDIQFPASLGFVRDRHQLVLEHACRVVADAQVALQRPGRDVVIGRGHEEHGQEPFGQGQLGVLEDRVGGDADLITATVALPKALTTSLDTLISIVPATRTDETRRPALFRQRHLALRLRSVTFHAFAQRQPSLEVHWILHGSSPLNVCHIFKPLLAHHMSALRLIANQRSC